jgi:hypothetical protein
MPTPLFIALLKKAKKKKPSMQEKWMPPEDGF